jgi:hypothetical protein
MSLEEVRTHERRYFASLEQLFAFLSDEITGAPDSDDTAPDNPL